MKLVKRTLLSLAIVVMAIIFGLYLTIQYKLAQETLLSKPILLKIKNGTSFNAFSKLLVTNKVIDTRFWLRNFVRFNKNYVKIKAGTYRLSPEQSLSDILSMIVAGNEHQFSVTFIEGTTLKQWLAILNEHPYVQKTLDYNSPSNSYSVVSDMLSLDNSNPEGLFFPDTYKFTNNTKDIELLRRAHFGMQNVLKVEWDNRASGLPYDHPYQALIMASIIEKESGQHSELAQISSVFVNRLNEGMRLQTDPTVIYGLGERYQGDIKRKHLREKTAYNTYRIDGLPPTPIAMPGKASIKAALNPAASDYFYFVSDGQGKHIFSTNLKDHNRAVRQYQLGIVESDNSSGK